MGDQIDGKIKWCDAGDGSERKTADDAPASSGEFLPVEREDFAVDTGALLGGHVKSKDGAFDLNARALDGLASFLSQSVGKFFFASE